jgi:hypothetical protein
VRALRGANLALAFFLEIGVLVAIVVWGFAAGSSRAVDLTLGLGGAAAWASVWGVLGSPQGRVRLHGVVRILFEIVWFGAGAVALVASGHHVAGIVLMALWALNATLLRVWKQRPQDLPPRARRVVV